MGSDRESLHHRKAKIISKRSAPSREPYPKILIVCEGRKTEPHYFTEIKNEYEISSANIRISGESGSAPCSVLAYGMQLFAKEIEIFDRVYFVFDKDTHSTFEATVEKINGLKKKYPSSEFFAITSVPCFEYWLLLHHSYIRTPYAKKGKKSPADCVIANLYEHMPMYEKGGKTYFHDLKLKLDSAKANAKKALKDAELTGCNNPSTHIHVLVDFLQNIKVSARK